MTRIFCFTDYRQCRAEIRFGAIGKHRCNIADIFSPTDARPRHSLRIKCRPGPMLLSTLSTVSVFDGVFVGTSITRPPSWHQSTAGMKPSPIPCIWCKPGSWPSSAATFFGSTATMRASGRCSLRNFPTPWRVPPLSTPAQKQSSPRSSDANTFPRSFFVVHARLSGFSNAAAHTLSDSMPPVSWTFFTSSADAFFGGVKINSAPSAWMSFLRFFTHVLGHHDHCWTDQAGTTGSAWRLLDAWKDTVWSIVMPENMKWKTQETHSGAGRRIDFNARRRESIGGAVKKVTNWRHRIRKCMCRSNWKSDNPRVHYEETARNYGVRWTGWLIVLLRESKRRNPPGGWKFLKEHRPRCPHRGRRTENVAALLGHEPGLHKYRESAMVSSCRAWCQAGGRSYRSNRRRRHRNDTWTGKKHGAPGRHFIRSRMSGPRSVGEKISWQYCNGVPIAPKVNFSTATVVIR